MGCSALVFLQSLDITSFVDFFRGSQEEQTRDGVIACQDGFRAVTFTEDDFIKFGEASRCRYEIREVDESSLFLIIMK